MISRGILDACLPSSPVDAPQLTTSGGRTLRLAVQQQGVVAIFGSWSVLF
jgi:hypothetical protein